MSSLVIKGMERGLIPDFAIRYGIRNLCKERLVSLKRFSLRDYVQTLRDSPLAIETQAANDQHYELPPEFFSLVLGKNKKYSSAFWSPDCTSLDEAEDQALATTMDRAQLQNGMRILELGCGWGSLTLAMATKYPQAQIVALSNSAPQRLWIEEQARKRGLHNVQILTRNIVEVQDLSTEFGAFDRIVSVEMFEHLRNYELLFKRLSHWLKPNGKVFVHVFTHQKYSYPFETEGDDNWLGRYFFTGGQMPGRDLFAQFQNDLTIDQQWIWDGTHYAKTAEAWLNNMDQHRDRIKAIFDQTYGPDQSRIWVQRWRVFFMSCAELFNYKHGSEWEVTHTLFSKKEN